MSAFRRSATRGRGYDQGSLPSIPSSSTDPSVPAIPSSSTHPSSNDGNEVSNAGVHPSDSSSMVAPESQKILIRPDADGFFPNHTKCVRHIVKIIQSKFDEPWPSWKKVPLSVRDMWFGEFQKVYYWLPEHANEIRKNFEKRGSSRLRDIFADARKKPNDRPLWLTPEVWNGLLAYWRGEDFKLKSEIAIANRASDVDGLGASLHTGGSIPATEHKRRLEQQTGQEVNELQLFMHTHQKKDKSWVDTRSSKTYENFTNMLNERQSSESSTDPDYQLSIAELWVQQNKTKKGRIYGLGAEGVKYKGSSSSAQSAESNSQQMEQILAQLEKERREKEEMAAQIAELQKIGHETQRKMEENQRKMEEKFTEMMKMMAMSGKSGESSISPEDDENGTFD